MPDKKKAFLLRLDKKVHEALLRWSQSEMRSLNSHIEFVLRRALSKEGRLKDRDGKG